jgi:hypothetical protein
MNSADVTRASKAVGGDNSYMHHRKAQTQTEIDFLPPFGQPEVITTGDKAADVALAGVGTAALIAFARQS